mgnify:CR=1 FL=1
MKSLTSGVAGQNAEEPYYKKMLTEKECIRFNTPAFYPYKHLKTGAMEIGGSHGADGNIR